MKFARACLGWRGCFDSLDQLLDRSCIADKGDAVGIGHAEIDLILRLKLVADDFHSVHERAVTAAHVFENQCAVHGHNLGLLSADAAVAKRQFVPRLAADTKWRSGDPDLAARAVWFNDNEPVTTGHGCSRCWFRRKTLLMVGKLEAEVNSCRADAGHPAGRERPGVLW